MRQENRNIEQNKKHIFRISKDVLYTSGTGIRTPTNRVRVWCATVTQYRYVG